jgi:endonuclease/exonuclease/phosphatase family metal-dependent hydrolase
MFGHSPALPTFPSVRPVLPLDRIWVRPTAVLQRMTVHRTALSARASDHLPLKAVIEWAAAPRAPGP